MAPQTIKQKIMTYMLKRYIPYVAIALMMAACTNDDVELTPVIHGENYGQLDISDINPKTFSLDDLPETIAENEKIPLDKADEHYEDFSETWLADIAAEADEVKEVVVTFTSDGVTLSSEKNLDVEKHGGHVVIKSEKKRIYRLTGTCEDGSVKIYSDKKYGIILDGLHLTNPNGAVINLQKSIAEGSGKRCYMMIAAGTDNVLTDGASYTDIVPGEDEKGCIFSEGKLLIGRTADVTSTNPLDVGRLTVNAYGKNAIACDDYVYLHQYSNIRINAWNGNGIKTNDGIFVGGGVCNVMLYGDGAKGLASEGEIAISGGRIAIVNDGLAVMEPADTSYAACIKCDSTLTVTGGAVIMRSCKATGSEGIICKQEIRITDGMVKAYCYDNCLKAQSAYIADERLVYLESANGKAILLQ